MYRKIVHTVSICIFATTSALVIGTRKPVEGQPNLDLTGVQTPARTFITSAASGATKTEELIESIENFPKETGIGHSLDVTPATSDDGHAWGISQHVKYYFHCRHLGYYYVNFRWQVLKVAGDDQLRYENIEGADVFSDKSQWGSHPIEFGGIFHHGFCYPTPHMICSYRLSGAFEGALYPHINIAQMMFIDDRQNPLRSTAVHPTVTESCMTYNVDAAPFCANGLGEACRIIHVKIDRPVGINAKVVVATPTRLTAMKPAFVKN